MMRPLRTFVIFFVYKKEVQNYLQNFSLSKAFRSYKRVKEKGHSPLILKVDSRIS